MEYDKKSGVAANKAFALIKIANELEKLNTFLAKLPKDEDGVPYISANRGWS